MFLLFACRNQNHTTIRNVYQYDRPNELRIQRIHLIQGLTFACIEKAAYISTHNQQICNINTIFNNTNECTVYLLVCCALQN